MSVGLVVNPAIRGFRASARMSSRSAPSANMRVEISSSTASPRWSDRASPTFDSESLTGGMVEKLRDPVEEIRGDQVGAHAPHALVGSGGICDQHGPASCGLPGLHIG